MEKKRIRNKKVLILRKYFIIFLGAFLMALSVNLVYEPMQLVTGGVAGLAIAVKAWTSGLVDGGIPVWLFTIFCNIPLFIIALKIRGVKFLLSTLFGTSVYIISMMLIPIVDFGMDDYLLASIVGAALGGAGIGLVFSVHASTGGTDLVAYILQHKNRHMSVPQLLIFVDGAIIIIGALTFGLGNALYALIAVFLSSKVSDSILEGLKFAKMAYIISDRYQEIADAILKQMDRGVTGVNATGMYSNKEKKMLFCVVSRKEIVKIIEIAQKIDSRAFLIISDVREVMGEGFIEYGHQFNDK